MSEAKVAADNKQKKPPLLPVIAAALVVVGAATFFFGQQVGAGSKAPKKGQPGYRLKLEEMVVNLRDRDQFIKVTPEVEFKKQGRGEEATRAFEPFVSRVEGAITLVFRGTPVERLNTEAGIRQVERQMIRQINHVIEEPEGKVKNVVIGKFATQ